MAKCALLAMLVDKLECSVAIIDSGVKKRSELVELGYPETEEGEDNVEDGPISNATRLEPPS